VINVAEFLGRFITHVNSLRSAGLVCSVATGLEGWFRVEVTPVLMDMGAEKVSSRFDFPGGGQADLAAEFDGHRAVFEIMCLVEGADAKKIERFPSQLDRLENAVRENAICEGLAIVTFQYPRSGSAKVDRLRERFFGERQWTAAVGPQKACPNRTLEIYVAGLVNGNCGHRVPMTPSGGSSVGLVPSFSVPGCWKILTKT
jgi:hypothetical protein